MSDEYGVWGTRVLYYTPMPYSGNINVCLRANSGYWRLCMNNKAEPKLEEKIRGAIRLKQY